MAAMIVVGLGGDRRPGRHGGGGQRARPRRAAWARSPRSAPQDPARAQASFADGLRGVYTHGHRGPVVLPRVRRRDVVPRPGAASTTASRDAARKLGGGGPAGPALRAAGAARTATTATGPPRSLARARSNGDLFLAFPANGDERNSINDEDSLFRALCGADSDDDCTRRDGRAGPLAHRGRAPGRAPAGWPSSPSAWPGCSRCFGFLALRLLGAAIIAMLCLLLAPLAVLAPALGEGGRAAFRGWGLRLLGALVEQAPVLGLPRRRAARAADPRRHGRARLVDAVAADRRLLVDRLRPPPPRPRVRDASATPAPARAR